MISDCMKGHMSLSVMAVWPTKGSWGAAPLVGFCSYAQGKSSPQPITYTCRPAWGGLRFCWFYVYHSGDCFGKPSGRKVWTSTISPTGGFPPVGFCSCLPYKTGGLPPVLLDSAFGRVPPVGLALSFLPLTSITFLLRNFREDFRLEGHLNFSSTA